MRILKNQLEFKDLIARVLSFDYLGALVASKSCFRSCFVPRLGLVRTSLVIGLVSGRLGLWGTFLLAPLLARAGGVAYSRGHRHRALVRGSRAQDLLTELAEDQLFADPIPMTSEVRTSPRARHEHDRKQDRRHQRAQVVERRARARFKSLNSSWFLEDAHEQRQLEPDEYPDREHDAEKHQPKTRCPVEKLKKSNGAEQPPSSATPSSMSMKRPQRS